MNKFITASYTILKNEIKFIEKWLYYSKPYTYRVLLDTGSTDGSWELLQQHAAKDRNLIIEQKTFDPWRFDVARKYNLSMVPKDVEWCLSPDLDEYYSINTLDTIQSLLKDIPNTTCIACDRLDVYSKIVRVGPPDLLPTNKIHLKDDYTWAQPIYEHLAWKHKDRYEKETYCDSIYLIHDQEFNKPQRNELYIKMLEEEYTSNPTNTWCLWFYIYHLYISKQLDKYIPACYDFLKYHKDTKCKQYQEIVRDLNNLYRFHTGLSVEQKEIIKQALKI